MRAINVFLAIVVSLLIGLVVFEAGLRLTRFAPTESANQFDPELGWSKRPGAVVERSSPEYDITLEINELGLRDDPMSSPKKPAGVFRVICRATPSRWATRSTARTCSSTCSSPGGERRAARSR